MAFLLRTLLLLCLCSTALLAQIKLNSVDFAARMEAQEDVQVIDVRTPAEYGEGHLKAAVNIDFKSADFPERIQGLAKSKPVMLYCLGESKSEAAARLLVENGFTEVYNLAGGYMSWTVERRPVEGIKKGSAKEDTGMRVFEFNDLLNTDMPVLVDFTAKWCAPCKVMYPHVRKMEEEFKGKAVVKVIDIDKHPSLAEHLGIKYLPLVYLYKNGAIVWQATGVVGENKLREVISQQL